MPRKSQWPEPNAQWIWTSKTRPGVNQYAEFRRTFNLTGKPTDCQAFISADSDYELWINGHRAGGNQFSDWPRAKTFNTHPVDKLLRPGRNCIAVRVYYRGAGFFTYALGKPGLIVALRRGNETLLKTDPSWRCRISPSYRSGRLPKVTLQLGFTIEYDARGEDAWRSPSYRPNSRQWSPACELAGPTDGYWQSLQPRPLPPLTVDDPRPADLVAAGYLLRDREKKTVAQTMTADALITAPLADQLSDAGIITAARVLTLPQPDQQPLALKKPPRGHGIYLVFDLGGEEAGLLDLDLDAPAGTVLDIAHGEHLDDLRVRARLGERNFADRYICRPGRQQWLQAYRRLGCRYLQIHIPRLTAPIKIYHATLRPVNYPFQDRGAFTAPDEKLNDINRVARRTMQLCAHEHYEDCPWREQGLYACDSRLQALYGYYAFGETHLPGCCWSLLGDGLRDDGLLPLTAPAHPHITIPGFSLHWISAVWEHALYSADTTVVRNYYDAVCNVLDTALQRLTPAGVVTNSDGADHWHFHEWTDGLDGYDAANVTDAIYNLLLLNALRAAARAGRLIDDTRARAYERTVPRFARAVHDVFWNPRRNAYASFRRKGRLSHYAQLTQALAIIEGVTRNKTQARRLCDTLAHDPSLVSAEYPSKLFLYQALLTQGEKYARHILDDIRTTFGGMLAQGATSLWEAAGGGEAFSRAGSLCHAWSAVPVYVAGAHLLGVRPLEPGFKRFTVNPVTAGLPCAQGVVPTPRGLIRVQWEHCNNTIHLRLKHPRSLTPVITPPPGKKIKLI